MAVNVIHALLAGGALVGPGIAQAKEAKAAREQSERLVGEQRDRQLKLEAEAKEKGIQEQRNKARDVQASIRSRGTGNSVNPDIRTSPSGLDANLPFGGAKTLLGM